ICRPSSTSEAARRACSLASWVPAVTSLMAVALCASAEASSRSATSWLGELLRLLGIGLEDARRTRHVADLVIVLRRGNGDGEIVGGERDHGAGQLVDAHDDAARQEDADGHDGDDGAE